MNSNIEPQVNQIISQAVAEDRGYIIKNYSDEEINHYLNGFSFGALIYGFFYYAQMHDKLYSYLSLFIGILFPPVNIILAFTARYRSRQFRQFQDFNEFRHVQSRWDRAGWIGLILATLFLFWALYFIWTIISKSSLLPSYNSVDLKSTYQSLSELLGTN